MLFSSAIDCTLILTASAFISIFPMDTQHKKNIFCLNRIHIRCKWRAYNGFWILTWAVHNYSINSQRYKFISSVIITSKKSSLNTWTCYTALFKSIGQFKYWAPSRFSVCCRVYDSIPVVGVVSILGRGSSIISIIIFFDNLKVAF